MPSSKIRKQTKNKITSSQKILVNFLLAINNKPSNIEMLKLYLFDHFANNPKTFKIFLDNLQKEIKKYKNSPQGLNLAQKYLEVISPLSERFSFYKEKNLLDDVSFKLSSPKKYEEIDNLLALYKKKSKQTIGKIIKALKESLNNKLIPNYKILGRYKNIYSIYKKILKRPDKNALSLNDIFAFRIIIESNDPNDCFEVLNILRDHFTPITEYFKDYITIPKINGYQSLHTGLTNIIENLNLPVEIQIRTQAMNDYAENGPAAHWYYSQKKSANLISDKEKKLFAHLTSQKSQEAEFIHVVTYKGDMIKLERNSTVLDFAYEIHTDLGNKAKYALIYGQKKPLNYVLTEGDKVEVITSNKEQVDGSWHKMVNTKLAKKKIANYFKKS